MLAICVDYQTQSERRKSQAPEATASDITLMRDTLLRESWRVIILSMIFTLVLIGLSMIYRALFAALGGAWPNAAWMLAGSLVAAAGLKWLCDNRTDLVES